MRHASPVVLHVPDPSSKWVETLTVGRWLPEHYLSNQQCVCLQTPGDQQCCYQLVISCGKLQAHLWWAAAGSGLRCALVALLDDLPADLPLLLLATAELPATDADAAAAGTAGSSRRLLPGPSSTAAAAAAGRASTAASGQEQPGECLEELGLDPTLAALFPPLGCLSDLQGLLLRKTAQQDADLPQGQQNPQAGMADPQQQQQLEQHCSQVEAAAGHGRGVLGWVLLQPPGPLERRKMFQASTQANDTARHAVHMQVL